MRTLGVALRLFLWALRSGSKDYVYHVFLLETHIERLRKENTELRQSVRVYNELFHDKVVGTQDSRWYKIKTPALVKWFLGIVE